MNFIEYFFRTTVEEPPSRILLISINIVVIGTIFYYYYKDKKYINPKIIAVCNLVQQALLYYWYIFRIPERLFYQGFPLYHCRISIIIISIYILLGKKSKVATFFAYLGLWGSVVTLLSLDLDNFGLIHFSHFSYLIGHYLLSFNALHIMREDKDILDWKVGVFGIILLNSFIQIFNLNIENANYAELARMPDLFSFKIPQPYYFVLVNFIYFLIFLLGRFVHKKLNFITKQLKS